ncbi:MAG: DUF2561 family protein [Mycobacterium sp.]|uniref:DUF2561 family protein n=1 Tax=Mycobacterium sp. TaxID=1785 RepID=UPI003CC665D4
MADRFSADRRGWPIVSPLATDRILVGTCAAIWLVLVGASVAAVVALMDLGRGFSKSPGSQHTPAVLYTVIIVSALVIAAAIPVLVRARRISRARSTLPAGTLTGRSGEQAREPGYSSPPAVTAEPGTERLPTLESVALSRAEVDRIWLRGAITLLAVMGGALIFVAVATYLMAIGRNGLAWTGYGLAAAVTATMPVLVWWHDRQLHRMLAAGTSFE